MADHSVHRAADLARDERLLIERLLGRMLSDDETISVNAYLTHFVPAEDHRQNLKRKIAARAHELDSRAPDPTQEEIDALIDKTVSAVRRRRA